jgi:hypothetical protein
MLPATRPVRARRSGIHCTSVLRASRYCSNGCAALSRPLGSALHLDPPRTDKVLASMNCARGCAALGNVACPTRLPTGNFGQLSASRSCPDGRNARTTAGHGRCCVSSSKCVAFEHIKTPVQRQFEPELYVGLSQKSEPKGTLSRKRGEGHTFPKVWSKGNRRWGGLKG